MSIITIYRATHIETGEVLFGNADELADKFGVSAKSIYRAASININIKYCWKIEKMERGYTEKDKSSYPKELLAEWDAVTKPFKKAYRKARERKENLGCEGE